MKKQFYIGDGVYASDDGYHIVLQTKRDGRTEVIYLDSEGLHGLFKFIEKTREVSITVEKNKPKPEAGDYTHDDVPF